MLPGDVQPELEGARYVVLLEVTEELEDPGPGDPDTWSYVTRCGVLTVPQGSKRTTIIRTLLEGQGEVGSKVPQVQLVPGQEGVLFVVAEGDIGDAVPVRARHRLVLDVQGEVAA